MLIPFPRRGWQQRLTVRPALAGALLTGALLAALAGPAQAQTLAPAPPWQGTFQGTSTTNTTSSVQAITADADGNIFVTGTFSNNLQLGTLTLASGFTNTQAFVAKWSPVTGDWVWATRLESNISSSFSTGFGIAVSGSNVYVTGQLFGSASFAGASLTSAGGNDVFLLKYRDDGASATPVWGMRAGGTSTDAAQALTVSGTSIYVTGTIGSNAVIGTTTFTIAGSSDPFIAKFEDDGPSVRTVWATTITSSGSDQSNSVAVNGASVYITGSCAGTLTFNGTSTTITGTDAFTAKFTDSGTSATPQWITTGNANGPAMGQGIGVSGNNVYVAGNTGSGSSAPGQVDFAGTTLPIAGFQDVFLVKYVDNGSHATVAWGTTTGSTGSESGRALVVKNDNIYVTGSLSGPTVIAGTSLTSRGGTDVFLAKYQDRGNTFSHAYATTGGGASGDIAQGIAVVPGRVYVAGSMAGTTTFDNITLSSSTTAQRVFGAFLSENNAPTGLTLSQQVVVENVAAVGTLVTADDDPGEVFTYSLVPGAGDADNGAFTIHGDELMLNAPADFETRNSYTVRVRTTDASGFWVEQTFPISITDVNEAPTAPTLSATTIVENLPAGTVIGSLSATDQDAGNTVAYALVSGAGDTDNAAFVINGDRLALNAPADYETQASYAIRVGAIDQDGLSTEQTFVVTVINVSELVLTTSATDASCTTAGMASVTATGGIGALSYDWTGSPAGDGTATISGLAAGTYSVRVTDGTGAQATADVTVGTAPDVTAPVALAQDVTVALDATGHASVTASQIDNGSSDKCGIATLSVSPNAFDCAKAGANVVTLTVTDVHGNASTATAMVTVVDQLAPIAVAQNVTVALDASGQATVAPAQVDNGSSDNCGIGSMAITPSSCNCTDLGAHDVTLTVVDAHGNVSTALAVVTVTDPIAPTISCAGNVYVAAAPGDCTPAVSWTAPEASDNCSAHLTSSHQPGDHFPVGTTTVTYTAQDAAGNIATCSFTVTVAASPLTASVSSSSTGSSCGGATSTATVAVQGGCQPYAYQWSNGQTSATATGLGAGTHSVMVTDANGTSVTQSLTLTATPVLSASIAVTSAPVFTPGAVPATIYLGYGRQNLTLTATVSGGTPGYAYSWSPLVGVSAGNTASITVAPTATTVYTLTITDAAGCTTQQSFTVNIIDARCGTKNDKVEMCHGTGNGSYHTICIPPAAVQAQLAQGWTVGECPGAARVAGPVLSAYPNPNNGQFTVLVRATTSGAATLTLLDAAGTAHRTLFKGDLLEGESREISVDQRELPAGIYSVRLLTGEQSKLVRVVVNP